MNWKFWKKRRDYRIGGVYAGPEEMARLLGKPYKPKDVEIEDVYAGPEPDEPEETEERPAPMMFVYAGPGQKGPALREDSLVEAVYAGPDQMNNGFFKDLADKLSKDKPYPENYADEKKRFKFCPICGRPNDPDAKFCKECGSSFGKNSQETLL